MCNDKKVLVLVSCVKGKDPTTKTDKAKTVKAKNLYIGWFKDAKKLVEDTKTEWVILTDYPNPLGGEASRTVIDPEDDIKWYDKDKKFDQDWADRVWQELKREKGEPFPYQCIVCLLSIGQTKYLRTAIPNDIKFIEPLAPPGKRWEKIKSVLNDLSNTPNDQLKNFWCSRYLKDVF